jgi:hypothetical protein
MEHFPTLIVAGLNLPERTESLSNELLVLYFYN